MNDTKNARETLGSRITQADGHPTGFDYLRLFLAASVIVFHSALVTAGLEKVFASEWRLAAKPIVPMFFGLSGFLVTGSLYRCASLISFAGFRFLRIFPALAVEVCLSALILGPFFTTVPLNAYFSSPEFGEYFLNMVGDIHYRLPGVFDGNPFSGMVNGQLTTIPPELWCYITLFVLAFTRIAWKPPLLLKGLLGVQFLLLAAYVLHYGALNAWAARKLLVGDWMLVYSFLWGVAFYLYRDAIPRNCGLFAGAVAAMIVLYAGKGGQFLAMIPTVYAMAYLGTLNFPKVRLLFSGDYSYGMYLYGFPIQQALVALAPGMGWFANAALGLLAAFGVAHISWRLVEKPTLRLKPRFLALERKLLRLPAKERPSL